MASTALAYRQPERIEPISAPRATIHPGTPSWHQQQNDRIASAFAATKPATVRLPLAMRVSVIVGGALLGWAVPIAVAASIVR